MSGRRTLSLVAMCLVVPGLVGPASAGFPSLPKTPKAPKSNGDSPDAIYEAHKSQCDGLGADGSKWCHAMLKELAAGAKRIGGIKSEAENAGKFGKEVDKMAAACGLLSDPTKCKEQWVACEETFRKRPRTKESFGCADGVIEFGTNGSYIDKQVVALKKACDAESDPAACHKQAKECEKKYWDAYHLRPADGDKCAQALMSSTGVCGSAEIIKACLALRRPNRCGATSSDGSPRLDHPEKFGPWFKSWKSLDCGQVGAFEKTYASCLIKKGSDQYWEISKEDLPAKAKKLGIALPEHTEDCKVWLPSEHRRCKECDDGFKKHWHDKVGGLDHQLKVNLETWDKNKVNADESLAKKSYSYAAGQYQYIMNDVTSFRAKMKGVLEMNGQAKVPADVSNMEKLSSTLTDKEATYRKGWLAALEQAPCPKGKKRNKGLESSLKKVYAAWLKDKTDGKQKVHEVRTNDPLYKETLGDGTQVHTQDTWTCIEKLNKTEEPRCAYNRISFVKRKPRGQGWSSWGVSGLGESGGLLCKNVKK